MTQQQEPSNPQPAYPQYYRKAGKCIRVDCPTEAWMITLPPEKKVPCRDHTTYHTHERLKEDLRGFEPVDAGIFKNFLFTFYQGVASEREQLQTWKIAGEVKPGIVEPR